MRYSFLRYAINGFIVLATLASGWVWLDYKEYNKTTSYYSAINENIDDYIEAKYTSTLKQISSSYNPSGGMNQKHTSSTTYTAILIDDTGKKYEHYISKNTSKLLQVGDVIKLYNIKGEYLSPKLLKEPPKSYSVFSSKNNPLLIGVFILYCFYLLFVKASLHFGDQKNT